jgi:tRNA(Ile)-lysidine synthase
MVRATMRDVPTEGFRGCEFSDRRGDAEVSFRRSFALKFLLEETGQDQGWWGQGTMLVALSGGGDSVALLALLKLWAPNLLVAATVDHGIRGEASASDAAFAEELCRGWDIPIRVERARVPDERRPGETLEEAARRIRYGLLDRSARVLGASFVAVAHTRDDQAETILMNLGRGCGLRGLRGMEAVRGNIVRPLIRFGREELRGFLRREGIPWREDGTNRDETFLRNRVRLSLLPTLREGLNPRIEGHLLALAEEVAAVETEGARGDRELLGWVAEDFPGAAATWRRELLPSLEARQLARLIRLQGERLGLSALDRNRTGILAGLLRKDGPWRFQWEGGFEVRGGGRIGWLREGRRPPEEERRIDLSAAGLEIPFGPFQIRIAPPEERGNFPAPSSGGYSARLRLPSPTLRLLPLSRVEADSRMVPVWARPRWPALADDQGSGWSPLAGRFGPKAGEDCAIIVPVRVVRSDGGGGAQGGI